MTSNDKGQQSSLLIGRPHIFPTVILLFGPVYLHLNGLCLLELQQRCVFSLLMMRLLGPRVIFTLDEVHPWRDHGELVCCR